MPLQIRRLRHGEFCSVFILRLKIVFLLSEDMIMLLQPREIKDIKDFLLKARRKDAKCEWRLPTTFVFAGY